MKWYEGLSRDEIIEEIVLRYRRTRALYRVHDLNDDEILDVATKQADELLGSKSGG